MIVPEHITQTHTHYAETERQTETEIENYKILITKLKKIQEMERPAILISFHCWDKATKISLVRKGFIKLTFPSHNPSLREGRTLWQEPRRNTSCWLSPHGIKICQCSDQSHLLRNRATHKCLSTPESISDQEISHPRQTHRPIWSRQVLSGGFPLILCCAELAIKANPMCSWE